MSSDSLRQDFVHGLRVLRKSPGFTAIAVFSIAFGTGANVAMFSAVDALLLRPLPVERPHELITVGARTADGLAEYVATSYPDFDDVRRRTTTLTGVVGFHSLRTGLSVSPTAPRQVRLVTVGSGNFFADLGIPLRLGRGFRPSEDSVAGRDAVVVIDHGLWQAMFGGATDVLGRTLLIAGAPFTVIGVTDPAFTGVEGITTPGSAYVPLAMWPQIIRSLEIDPLQDRDLALLTVKARLAPGATLDQAQAELDVIADGLGRAYPETNRGRRLVALTPLQNQMSRAPVVAPLLVVLSILALAVLGVACANVAGRWPAAPRCGRVSWACGWPSARAAAA